ncbi:hypothetical protein HRR83_003352 [Exophiala dermatitidis]|uniref:Uncharacterized protein n=1 Tax=Exophiala dermatitidis TaxID=5970 RepID=A0AAN6EW45_EXODE|nr:hypothetical protein HRR74_004490 [Exophiala dermatitidis]KAJ4521093.1 hypothetical protein HRR73_003434 [Exophiala dermatitidis]KAJ4547677.1 hypothetical protein HRR76_000308 [Exophiala dermatitidis]KAJ4553615.1 hypothetical protein HRR77_001996 [Exophiala dermatitidis]KAJ4577942.1 hypothetical protein HRR79_001266 [Exophiala dermatitidis]
MTVLLRHDALAAWRLPSHAHTVPHRQSKSNRRRSALDGHITANVHGQVPDQIDATRLSTVQKLSMYFPFSFSNPLEHSSTLTNLPPPQAVGHVYVSVLCHMKKEEKESMPAFTF